MMHPPIERVLNALRDAGCRPRRVRHGWVAHCPAHDDRKPSLSIAEGRDGRCLIRCHAGCSPEAVLRALALTFVDLRPDSTPKSPGLNWENHPLVRKAADVFKAAPSYPTPQEAITALSRSFGRPPDYEWVYTDPAGTPVGYTLRWDTPTGKQIRPVSRYGPNDWRIAAAPSPRPLYRLPDILKSPPNEPVWVFEGEKTADAGWACGLVSTCSAGGANAAAQTEWTPLRGRRVVVCPDNDDAGDRYASDVVRLCTEAGAADVCVLRLADHAPALPSGGDLADILESPTWCGLSLGETAEPADLGRRLRAAADTLAPIPTSGPVIVRLADVEPREVVWLWEGRIPLGRLSLLVGLPGSGKSLLTIDMAARVTQGSNWPDGAACLSGTVLFVSVEDSLADIVRGRVGAAGADLDRFFVLPFVRRVREDGRVLEIPISLSYVDEIEDAVGEIQPRLVVLDPIGQFFPGGVDINTETDVRQVLGRLAQIADRYQTAMLLVAHRRKARVEFADDAVLGSRAFVGLARSVWHICHDPVDTRRRLFVAGKNNLAPPQEGLAFRIQGDLTTYPVLEWEPTPISITANQALAQEYDAAQDGSIDEAQKVLTLSLTHGPRLAEDVMAEMEGAGFSERTIRRAKAALGVRSRKRGYSGKWEWYLPEGEQPSEGLSGAGTQDACLGG